MLSTLNGRRMRSPQLFFNKILFEKSELKGLTSNTEDLTYYFNKLITSERNQVYVRSLIPVDEEKEILIKRIINKNSRLEFMLYMNGKKYFSSRCWPNGILRTTTTPDHIKLIRRDLFDVQIRKIIEFRFFIENLSLIN